MSFFNRFFKGQIEQPVARRIDQDTEPRGLAAKRLVLDELRRSLGQQLNAADGLDSKLRQLLSSASLILSLVTVLQITTGIAQADWPYLTGLVAVLILYVALIVVILRGLRPMTYSLPIPSNWDEIEERFFALEEDAAIELLISNYLAYSPKTAENLKYKSDMVRWASVLLVMIVVVLTAMGLFGLSGNVIFPWQSSPVPTP